MGKNGGARPGAGRKSKAEEIKLAESIRNVIDDETLLNKLAQMAQDDKNRNQYKAIELLTGYLYGKPTQRVETKKLEDLPEIHFVRAKKQS